MRSIHGGRLACILTLVPLVGCAAANPAPGAAAPGTPASGRVGVLIMAHGGSPSWNAAVETSMAPLTAEFPTEIAFGMAKRETLQEAMARLEEAGVARIAVVRLFISGSSFLHRTEYLLGTRDDPPAHRGGGDSSSGSETPKPIARRAAVAIDQSGLSEAAAMGSILRQRVEALSLDPGRESVLLLAHGLGTEESNRALIGRLDGLADSIRSIGPYRTVDVETLREDWPEERVRAERRIRARVLRASENGGRAVIVPVRLFGFGPYREVLDGLEYVTNEVGLLPHPLVVDWVRERAVRQFCENGWPHPLGDCREWGSTTDPAVDH